MAGFRFNGAGQYGFAPSWHRPRQGPAWRVNTGVETANRTVAPGPVTPRTDFSQALRPRLGGLMKPQLDFRTDAQKSKDMSAQVAASPFLTRLQSDAKYYGVDKLSDPNMDRGIRANFPDPARKDNSYSSWTVAPNPPGATDFWDTMHPPTRGADASMIAMEGLRVPSDTPPPAPMFGDVSDTPGAPTPTPSSVQDGWVTTGQVEQQSIASRYSPMNQPVAMSNLPY